MNNRHIILFILTLASITWSSCTKLNEQVPDSNIRVSDVPVQKIQDCHNQANYTTAQISMGLRGNWRWAKSYNPWTQNTSAATKQVTLHINDATNYSITEGSSTVASGTWSLSTFSNNSWTLELSQEHPDVKGVIYMCGHELLLSTMYVDGPANYFLKQ